MITSEDKNELLHALAKKASCALDLTSRYELRPCDFKDYMQGIMFITEAMKNISKIS